MRTAYTIFYTEDIERITNFYRDTLGLEIEELRQNSFVSFKLENGLLGIKNKVEEREIPGSQTIIVSVNNIDEIYKEFKEKDLIWYKDLIKQDWGTNFAILDPDGNKFDVVQNN
jgi:predicted enzyme related to lactoylglutathione lyase